MAFASNTSALRIACLHGQSRPLHQVQSNCQSLRFLLRHIKMSLRSAQIARRSPWTCLSCSAITRTSQALIAVSTTQSPAHIHQHKHSSSKTPSSSKAEPRAIATPSEAPSEKAKPASKDATEKRPSTRVDRRKLKDVAGTGTQDVGGKPSNEMTRNPPRVPSTAHLHLSGTTLHPIS